MRPASLPLLASGPCSAAAVLYRMLGSLNVTVIVKATLSLVHEGPAEIIEPEPVNVDDRPAGGVEERSLEAASDLAPYKGRADVTFIGRAHVPGAAPAPTLAVRLAVFRDKALLDKTLRIYGDRAADRPSPAPFHAMPIVYERAFGGATFADNPAGVGADVRVRGGAPEQTGAALPNLVDPSDPSKPAGFGPISPRWAARTKLLGAIEPAIFETPIATVPSAHLFDYFQSAPLDQQIDHLRGDEWIVLDHLHPSLPRLSSRLPQVRAECRFQLARAGGLTPPKSIAMRLDTLAIDGERARCSVVFRGTFTVAEGEKALAGLRIACGLGVAGQPIAWPDLDTPAGPAAGPPERALARTAALTDAQQAQLSSGQAVPFTEAKGPSPAAERAEPPRPRALGATIALPEGAEAALGAQRATPFADRPPDLPVPEAPRVPSAAAPIAPPALVAPAPGRFPAPTVTFTPKEQAELREARRDAPVTPFVPGSAPPEVAVSSSPRIAPRSGPITGTAALSDEDLAALARIDPLPFRLPEAPAGEAPVAAASGARAVPERRSDAVPIVTDLPLAVATLATQIRPPRESLTVVAKGNFVLHEGAPARLRDEPDPVLGDVYLDDDPQRSLVYPSDLAYFKPRCDVTLTGTARAPGGSATHMQVGLSLGSGARRVERTLHVIGDRTWKKALGVSLAPTDPASFTDMPLAWDRAFGGPDHAPNPAGTGHKSATLPDGTLRLPNLEDPAKPITSPGDSPPPQCFAPISPSWKPRARFAGTYDKRWLATRWPYQPEDFDWKAAQHAPASQQLDAIDEDAPYEIQGMSAERPVLRGALPGVKVRCFIERAQGGFVELPMKLDTAHFMVDAGEVALVWRGLVEVEGDRASEIACLFVTAEPLAGPSISLEKAREKMLDLLSPPGESEERPEGDPANDVRPLPPAPPVDPGLRARIAAGEDLAGADLSDADLSDLDLSGRSLAGAILLRASLRNSKLAGADLSGAQLGGADLRGARLSGAKLDLADLTGAHLDGADLSNASLTQAALVRCQAGGAVLRGARGAETSFVESDLSGAAFDEALLPSADLSKARLDGCSFVKAGLAEVRLIEARGERVRFDGATMPGARAESALFRGGSFREVVAPRSGWNKAEVTMCSFVNADLSGAGFSEAKAEGINLTGADVKEGRFGRADLRGAKILGANLMQATFEGADLTGADLRGSSLHEAETWKAKLEGASLDLAIVTRSKLAKKR